MLSFLLDACITSVFQEEMTIQNLDQTFQKSTGIVYISFL